MPDSKVSQARVWRLLERCIELPAEEQEKIVVTLGEKEPEIEKELRRLLARDRTGDSFLTMSVPSLIEEVPEVIGPYRLREKIGEGGSGIVYRAARAEGLPRYPVAIKILRHGWDSEAAARFSAESELFGALEHPGICRMLATGQTPAGAPWIAMEFVEGHAIDRYCLEADLSLRARLKLFRQVLSAVEYAHSQQLIHRDLKPSNVLVDKHGTAKLVDFGIAVRLGEQRGVGGRVACTPGYASPEQLRGERVGPSSDIYALGCLLYQMICARKPYDVAGLQPDQVLEVLAAGPAPPSEGSRGSRLRAPPSWRANLDAVVLSAIAFRPEDRYLSVSRFADDVERILQGYPVRAREVGAMERLRLRISRHRVATAGAALIATAALALSWQTWRLAKERDIAAVARQRAATVNQLLVDSLADLDPATRPLEGVSALDLVHRASSRLQEVALEDGSRADLLRSLGTLFAGLGTYAPAVDSLEQALALYPEEAVRDRAKTLELLATAKVRAGEYDAAEDLARTALALQSEHGSSEQQQSALSTLAWTVLRNSRNEQHRHEEADRLATEAYAIALRGSPTAIELARLERLRAEILRQLGANDRGLELARHALERLEAESAVPAYERATTINQVAVLEESTGNYEAATESFTAVHRTLADLLGEHPDVAGALSNVGTSIAASGRFAAAAEVLLEAVALYDRVLDPEHPMTLNCVSSAAHAVQWSGNLSAAESLHRRVADGLEIALGAEHIFIPMARAFLAENLALQDRLDEAEKVLRASGRDRKRLEGSWMLLSYASIQAFVAGLGAESEATTAELERTYRELVESFGPNVRSAADARRRLELYKDRWSL